MSTNVDVVIQGGRVVCGESGRDVVADVHIAHNRITAIEEQRAGREPDVPQGARVVDARGCIVMPGMIDLGVHLRDPGREHDEDLATTLVNALRGGVTTLVALPDTNPAVDGSDDVLHRRAAASRALGENTGPTVVVAGALTRDRAGKEPADVADMCAVGVDIFSDACAVDDSDVLRRSLEYARGAGARLAILHGPDGSLSRGGVIVESEVSTRLGLAGIPELADALAAHKHIGIAALAHMPVHLHGLFTEAALDVVTTRALAILAARHGDDTQLKGARASLKSAPMVTASVHPWHLLLDETAHLERRYDTSLRLDPPLPTAASRTALVDAVKRGLIAVTSGHRAVPNRTKELEMAVAEAGASSLSLTLPLLCTTFTPLELARATSALPARILGMSDRGKIAVDARADLVVLRVFAPEDKGDVVDAALAGARAPANPFLGLRAPGRVECTVVAGRVSYVAKGRTP